MRRYIQVLLFFLFFYNIVSGQIDRKHFINTPSDVIQVVGDSLMITSTDSTIKVNSGVEIAIDPSLAPPITITPNLFESGTYRGILINSPVDDNLWAGLTLQAGLTATQRRYIEWKSYDGVRTGLLGFNNNNYFITYDATTEKHFMNMNPAGDSYLNSNGSTGRVVFNYYAGETHGNGGVKFANGAGLTLTASGLYGEINANGFYTYNGLTFRGYNPNNTDYMEMSLASSVNNYFNSTLPIKFKTEGSNIEFYDVSFNSLMRINTANGYVGIGTPTADEKFEIEWAAAVDIELGRGTTDTDVTFITLRSPNGTKYYITVDDTGAFISSASKP